MAYAFPPTNFEVTHEEFSLFHNTDHYLFTRLVADLGRDPAESMQVMALWLWLERARYCHNLVRQVLPMPLTVLTAMVNEAVVILSCIEHENFPANFVSMEIELTLTFALNEISLRFFYGIRMTVLRGVTELVQEVCSRAFQYIPGNNSRINSLGAEYIPYVEGGQGINSTNNVGVLRNMFFSNSPVVPRAFMRGDVFGASEITRAFNGGFDLSHQRQILGTELSELLDNITLNDNDLEEEENVAADDRTIFLTFSKGYPISETEVLKFFTRRYGRDCIEAIYMQDVLPNEQVLYARLVVKSASTISLVLGGETRTKFSINKKHVCARKYVKKQSHRTQGASTSSTDAVRRI